MSDHGASRFETAATLLAAWIVAGVYLVGWAIQSGLAGNATFTPFHVPGYLGMIALFAVVAERLFDRSVRGSSAGSRLRSAWAGRSTAERVIVLGTLVLVAYVVADLAWIAVFGIGTGLEARQAPSRLLLPLGLGLVASGWLVAASAAGRRVGWLGVVGLTAILSIVNFWLGAWHPVFSPWAAAAHTTASTMTSEIWTMTPDGRLQTRIVRAGPGEATQPAWSPDGRRIVYVAWTTGADGTLASDLWSVAADGTDPRQLTDDPAWDWIPAWSPDGAWIAFTSQPVPETPVAGAIGAPQAGGAPDTIASQDTSWSIYLVRPDGSDRHRLTAGGESMAPVWSPDGKSIAYHGTRDGNLDVYVAAAEGSGERRVTEDPGGDWSPSWSPDGTQLLFTSGRTGNDDVWLVGVDGKGSRNLTNDPAADQVPVWSPDGKRIAFVSDRSGDVEIWSMAADGSDVRNLTSSPLTDDGRWSVGWAADGSRLVYARTSPLPIQNALLVREDLGLTGMLLAALVLAAIVLAADRLGGLPRGGLTVVIGVSTLMIASVSDGWRFIPAGVLAGIAGDVLADRLRGATRRIALAAIVPATFVAADLLTVALTSSLGWSRTLSLGAVFAAALLGLGLAIATSRGERPAREAGD